MAFDPSSAAVGPACSWGTDYRSVGGAARRCFVWSGGPPSPALPVAGGDIDGVAGHLATVQHDKPSTPGTNQEVTIVSHGTLACPGWPVQVEASAAFAAGALLQTGADGRVATVSTGKAVLRALQAASGAGAVVWAAFTSGR